MNEPGRRSPSLADRIESLLGRGADFSTRPFLGRLGVSALLLSLLLAVGGLIPGWIAVAQTKAGLPTSFEVASIKPANPAYRIIGFYPSPGRFLAMHVRLQDLINYAYALDPTQLQGKRLPSWARSRRYTIEAVMPPDTAHLPVRQRDQLQGQMLQSLLADRFKLRVRWASKVVPVYDLVVAKGGPKMRLWSDADYISTHHQPNSMRFEVGSYTAWGNPTAQIAGNLTAVLGRKVIDKTGLTGRYSFNLTWTPWQSRASGMASSSGPAGNDGTGETVAPAPVSPGLSIFAAIQQQLGLRLKPAKGSARVLVVDHAEPPTPN
jgi:uncharacterized protein (TIGR03435 family)